MRDARVRSAIRVARKLGADADQLRDLMYAVRGGWTWEREHQAGLDRHLIAAGQSTGNLTVQSMVVCELVATLWTDVILDCVREEQELQRERDRLAELQAAERSSFPTPQQVQEQIARLGKGVLVPAHVDENGEPMIVSKGDRYDILPGHPIHALQYMLPPNAKLPDGTSYRGSTGVVPASMESGPSRVALLMSTFHKGFMHLQWAFFPDADPAIDSEVAAWLLRFEGRD